MEEYNFAWLKAFVQRVYSPNSVTTYMTSMNKLKGLIDKNDVFYVFNNPDILLEFIKTFSADNSAIIKHLHGVANKLIAHNNLTKTQVESFKAATTNKYTKEFDVESEVDVGDGYAFVDDVIDINTLPGDGVQFSSKNDQSMNA